MISRVLFLARRSNGFSKNFTHVYSSHKSNTLIEYGKLARLHRPIGVFLLYWPCSWGIVNACFANSIPLSHSLLGLFGVGAIAMRGAGCTINDMVDAKIDACVERTKDRPIASGRISKFQGTVFLTTQLTIALSVLLQLNTTSQLLGASSLALVAAYPFMKRLVNWPQTFLGLTFNWGALLGWTGVTGSIAGLISNALPFYIGGIFWTLFYDSIYAFQDLKCDEKLKGIRSSAMRIKSRPKLWLSVFALLTSASFLFAGLANDHAIAYYAGWIASSSHMAYLVARLNPLDPISCARAFKASSLTGFLLFAGLYADAYLAENSHKILKSIIRSLRP